MHSVIMTLEVRKKGSLLQIQREGQYPHHVHYFLVLGPIETKGCLNWKIYKIVLLADDL